jgi:hypothetical protein
MFSTHLLPLPSPQDRLTRSTQRYGYEYVQSCYLVRRLARLPRGRAHACPGRRWMPSSIFVSTAVVVEAQFPVPQSRRRGPMGADAPLLSSYPSHHAPLSPLGVYQQHTARRATRYQTTSFQQKTRGRCARTPRRAAAKSKAALNRQRLQLAGRGLP